MRISPLQFSPTTQTQTETCWIFALCLLLCLNQMILFPQQHRGATALIPVLQMSRLSLWRHEGTSPVSFSSLESGFEHMLSDTRAGTANSCLVSSPILPIPTMEVCSAFARNSGRVFKKRAVILRFIIRNVYLVFVPISGRELLKSFEFPKD